MRLLRPLVVALLALAVAAVGASAQVEPPTIKLPGGGQVKITLPTPKGKKNRTPASRRTSTVMVGIADEKAAMFSDLRFRALGFATARRSVAWDVFQYDWAEQEVDEWLTAARAAGVRPLVTWGRSRVHSKLHVIPTRAQMLTAFRRFRARWPWVTDFVASNESNYSDPGVKRPELMATYYKDMRKACRHCKIAAATLLEVGIPAWEKRTDKWVKRFVRKAGHRPKYWAVHNYVSANRFSVKGTKRMLKRTKSGEIWITEVGGLVKRRSRFAGKIKMREGLAHAARATSFIFDKMLPLSSRIKRVYLYHWDAAGPTDSWDSGLVAPDGRGRSSLNIVQSKLKSKGKKPRR